jgi:predicted amidohydrolase
MSRTVKAALLQTEWTGDKESMIDRHEEAARDAAAQGAHVMCFQELFYGPYFCQVQDPVYYDYTEEIPAGPTTQRFQSVAKELGTVLVLPMYERVREGLYYNTAAVVDADGTYLGKYRKQHIPHVQGFWEKFYFRPGDGGYYIGAINRVGIEPLGDDDFYGTSYFVDPEGKFVGDTGDANKPELLVRDLDMDLIKVVRDRWAFYRDRRPDAYGDLTKD